MSSSFHILPTDPKQVFVLDVYSVIGGAGGRTRTDMGVSPRDFEYDPCTETKKRDSLKCVPTKALG